MINMPALYMYVLYVKICVRSYAKQYIQVLKNTR